MKINTALILCAGFGKRLNPITINTPKPLLIIKNLTLLDHCINLIVKLNIKKVLINSFYLNAIFTFNKPINFNAFQRFLLLSIGGILATLLVDNISSYFSFSDQIKVIFAIIIVLPVNYILLKSFVYKA